jgi:hypothetical protein
MRVWSALLDGMRIARTHRQRRIGVREAEALLAGAPTRQDRHELVRLLAAAAGPAQPSELAGEAAALAAFAYASRQPPAPIAGRTGPTLVRALTRAVAVKLVAGAATLLIGGAALAAETGHLPESAQRRAHEMFSSLGVPSPHGKRPAPAAKRPSAAPSTPGPHGPDQGEPEIVRLCRQYLKIQKKDSAPLDQDELRKVATAAGGTANIAPYCTNLLNDHDGRKNGPAGEPSSSPQPGNHGKGHGKDNPPAQPGQDRHPHPSRP